MSLQKETVAIPFVSGIQPATRARLLDPAKLLVAENCQYVFDQGPQKRNGHTGRVVHNSAAYVPLSGVTTPSAVPPRLTYSTTNPNLPVSWVYGWGINGNTSNGSGGAIFDPNWAYDLQPDEVSPYPDVGQIFGCAARDDEAVLWDGHRMFSYASNQASRFGETFSVTSTNRNASCMPSMRVKPVAKISGSQLRPESADNAILRLVAWLNPGSTSASYSVFDSKTGACLVANQVAVSGTLKTFRCITVGPWFHMLYADTGGNSLGIKSFHQDNPANIISSVVGTVDDNFDVKKIDETKFIVARLKTNTITCTVLRADASVINTFTPTATFAPITNSPIAIEVDRFQHVGIVWLSGATPFRINFRVYNLAGAPTTSDQFVAAALVAARRVTLAPKYVPYVLHQGESQWSVYAEDLVSGVARVYEWTVMGDDGFFSLQTRHRIVLASHAISVGHKTFVWCANWLGGAVGLQSTWFLCDETLRPVGKMAYGLANIDLTSATYSLASVNWTSDNTIGIKDRIVYHGALGYNQRVPTSTQGFSPNGVFAEPSINFYELDFLPKLRSAQAGRTTYFAGAQLWAYDSVEAVEAGFHMAPEGVTGVAAGSGGSLSAGTVRYRVDLCAKNAQNEEVRSWSIITAAITTVNNDKVTLTIPVMPMTRRSNSYFLIFRTEANGTVYRLVNSRDPSSANFLKNDQTSATFTYVDTLSDANLLSREYHPANSGGNYLDPLPAPACELVAAGRDRLWLAGGELAPGEVAPSRLFQPRETPTFSPGLNIQVDRNAEPITAIGFLGDIAAIFRRTATYTLDSDGPDNSLNGFWPAPRLAISDVGATAQETLAVTVLGLWFHSPAGIRLLTGGGAMDGAAGMDMDPVTVEGDYSSAVVIPANTQVRWYSRDASKPSIVLDYSSNSWCTWTNTTSVGAIFWPPSNLAVLAKGDGYIWVEDETLFTDAGVAYETRFRVVWLRAAQLGDFQRIRRFALFGKCAEGTTIKTRLFYDERPFFEEEMTVNFASDSQFNNSDWGGESAWGQVGAWGDDSNTTVQLGSALWFRDGVFKFRKRPARQKCSVFSVEFSDNSGTNSGFVPEVLALEIAKKQGLDRIPTA